MVKNPPANAGGGKRCNPWAGKIPWVGKILWRRQWQPTRVFLPGESHGQRNWAGYSPWGHKESDTTERLSTPVLSAGEGQTDEGLLSCVSLASPS